MIRWSNYHIPRTVEAAIQTLEGNPHSALIAGGSDLLLDLDQGRHPAVDNLIDISRIDELQSLGCVDGYLVIGAAIPLSRLIANEELKLHAPGLVEACSLIGGPQVRNVATLGGNVAHALPAGDGTIALLSLGAEVHLASSSSREWVPLPSLFSGPGEVSFNREKTLITHLRIRARGALEGSAFRRVMRPQGVAIAILNMGVWLRCSPTGEVQAARIALGPGGPEPFLSTHGSEALIGQTPDDAVLEQVSEAILAEASFRTSRHRATKEYRQHLVNTLLRETVSAAQQRAMGE